MLHRGRHREVYHLSKRAASSGLHPVFYRLCAAALVGHAYRLDSIDVQTSGSYICCHQNINLLILKASAKQSPDLIDAEVLPKTPLSAFQTLTLISICSPMMEEEQSILGTVLKKKSGPLRIYDSTWSGCVSAVQPERQQGSLCHS